MAKAVGNSYSPNLKSPRQPSTLPGASPLRNSGQIDMGKCFMPMVKDDYNR